MQLERSELRLDLILQVRPSTESTSAPVGFGVMGGGDYPHGILMGMVRARSWRGSWLMESADPSTVRNAYCG